MHAETGTLCMVTHNQFMFTIARYWQHETKYLGFNLNYVPCFYCFLMMTKSALWLNSSWVL